LEYDCLWAKATRTYMDGMVLTGGAILTIGLGMAILGATSTSDEGLYILGGLTGLFFVGTGIVFLPVAGFIWLAGYGRKQQIKNTPCYKRFVPESLKISPTIRVNQFNNTHCLGMSVCLNF